MPANDKVRFYREAIGAKYPSCDNVWAEVDGLKLLIQEPAEDTKKNQLLMDGNMRTILIVFLFLVPMVKYSYA